MENANLSANQIRWLMNTDTALSVRLWKSLKMECVSAGKDSKEKMVFAHFHAHISLSLVATDVVFVRSQQFLIKNFWLVFVLLDSIKISMEYACRAI